MENPPTTSLPTILTSMITHTITFKWKLKEFLRIANLHDFKIFCGHGHYIKSHSTKRANTLRPCKQDSLYHKHAEIGEVANRISKVLLNWLLGKNIWNILLNEYDKVDDTRL